MTKGGKLLLNVVIRLVYGFLVVLGVTSCLDTSTTVENSIGKLIETLDAQELNIGQTVDDRICICRNSHNMARVNLCESKREFTLLVEKEDAQGNSNFDIIDSFIIAEETRIVKEKNATIVRLINDQGDELTIKFEEKSNGMLIKGKIVN